MRLMRGKEIWGPGGITGKSRSSVYRDVKVGSFPQPVKIGQRSVAWRSPDVDVWLKSRPMKGGTGSF
jgi:predicted DNA-binding transcriptional regulator AlpA